MVRVLVAGHSGLDKHKWINALSSYTGNRVGKVLSLDFDSMLSESMPYFLDSYLEKQRNKWYETVNQILGRIDKEQPDHVVISMHLTYFRHNTYWSLVDANALKEFKFDMILTLIDDAYSVWNRITSRESKERHGVYIRLRDVFVWRTVEIMMADMLATVLGVRNYVMAIKHPVETFYKIIFTKLPKAYLSHPISHVRSNSKAVGEINEFAKMLRNVVVLFEPTTIDELIIERNWLNGRGAIINKEDRWPTDNDDCDYPIRLKEDEVAEVSSRNPVTRRSLIQDQVMRRDFRYIEQSDMVVAYRPRYGGTLSRGVFSEVTIAVNMGKPVYVYWPPEDGDIAENPFEYVHEYFSSVDELLGFLKRQVSA
jgi:adenylate kinase